MANNRTKNTLMNTSFAVISRIVSMVMGFILKTVFIRTLGKAYTGISGLFSDILVMLSLAELGIGSAISFSLYKPLAETNYQKVAQLMNFFKVAYRIIALIVLTVGLALLPLLSVIVKDVPEIVEDIRLIYILYVINSAVSYLLVYKNTLLIADQKQYIVSTTQMVFTIIKVVIEVVLLLCFKQFLIYLILEILLTLGQNITINILAAKRYRELKPYEKEKLSKEERKKIFKDIWALMLYKVSNVVLTGTDSTIVSSALGTGQVGVLGNYKTIQGYVTSMVAQFYNSVNPSLGNLAATESKEVQYNFFKKLNFATFWIACFCSVCFFTLFNPFIEIWLGDNSWLLPLTTVAVFVLDYFLSAISGPIGAFRIANGLFVQTKYQSIIMAGLNLAISILLVKPLGILGVLIGTVVSRLLTHVWYEPLVIYKNVFGKSVWLYYGKLLLQATITVLGCFAIWGIMQLLPTMNIWMEFAVRVELCIIIPNFMIILIFYRTQEFKQCIAFAKNLFVKLILKIFKRRKNG